MKKLIRTTKRSPRVKALAVKVRRMAVIFLILIAMTFTTIMSVEALRLKFFDLITEIYTELTSITFIAKDKQSEMQFQNAVLKYIPKGFNNKEEEKTYTTAYTIYTNGLDEQIIFQQSYITNNQMIFDTEGTQIEKLQINGYEVQYFYNKQTHQFIWNQDEYVFSLMSTINKNELIKMIENIKMGKNFL